MTIPAFVGAILIGLSLGLTGAGGSIITLPVLVYQAGIPPVEAVGLSLFVVGVAALAGALQRIWLREFHAKAFVLFSASGIAGAAAGALLTPLISGRVLMMLFAGLMVAVAIHLLVSRQISHEGRGDCRPLRCLMAGLGVGVLTGFLGVGGGFLILPALMKFAKLPLRMATGTSLAIICVNAFAGFVSHFGGAAFRWNLAVLFSVTAAAGVGVGALAGAKLPVLMLRRIFAVLVLSVGGVVFWRSIAGA